MIPFTTRPEIRGTFGVAASTHWIATQVAMGVLERGGNAFDAASCERIGTARDDAHLDGAIAALGLAGGMSSGAGLAKTVASSAAAWRAI